DMQARRQIILPRLDLKSARNVWTCIFERISVEVRLAHYDYLVIRSPTKAKHGPPKLKCSAFRKFDAFSMQPAKEIYKPYSLCLQLVRAVDEEGPPSDFGRLTDHSLASSLSLSRARSSPSHPVEVASHERLDLLAQARGGLAIVLQVSRLSKRSYVCLSP